MNPSASNRVKYDVSAFQNQLHIMTAPLSFNMYLGTFENQNKCRNDRFFKKFDLVDVESELRNLDRPLSKSNDLEFSQTCIDRGYCMNTFLAPSVLPAEVCPIVHNNIPFPKSSGLPPL